MIIDEDDYLAHYGTPRRSGRYEWGSGGNIDTNARSRDFLGEVEELKRQGLSEAKIAEGMGMTTTQLRARKSNAKHEIKAAQIAMAERLREKQYSNTAAAEKMGIPESSYRALLAPGTKERNENLRSTAEMLKREVADKKFLDIGTGTEKQLGVSDTKMKNAVEMLRDEGYEVHPLTVRQVGTGLDTRYKILVEPGVTQRQVWENQGKIRQITEYSDDGGRSWYGILPPMSVNPDRVAVKYGSEGGSKADGVIFVRPGVEDVSLGGAAYAQVRVKVGDGHYLKGMAMYKDDLPDGVDLMFNTNKEDSGNKFDAFKPLSDDPDNPFGAVIKRQLSVKDANNNDKLVSAMNIVNEEGDWTKWSRNIASQVLSKQKPALAREQLDMTYESKKNQLDEIKSLTNSAVKKKLLKQYADAADSSSVHLKAAALPRQGWHAILPIDTLPPTQIYAPNYQNGERVALIRYPHGGVFEIPDLIVNNNHPPAKKLLGRARDAVGIHSSVAEKLSGADFDGDTVLVIPNNNNKIAFKKSLEGLKNFNPRAMYPEYPGMKVMNNTQTEMGMISNLITDMTIRKASDTELAQAVRHSMVVIDAEKHKLNYKQSELDNGIKALKAKYQGQPDGKQGASTLISRAKSKQYVPDRIERRASEGGPIDPVTGKVVYTPTGKINPRTGKPKLVRSQKLKETDDAHTLSSGTPMEELYANHSNKMKDLANQARLELLRTPSQKRSPSAAKVFAKEVDSLNAKLDLVVRNRPYERQAQVIANAVIRQKRIDKPGMDPDVLRKISFQALEEARARNKIQGTKIEFTRDEWNAIQAGAISENKLTQLLDAADPDNVRELATPQNKILMTPSKVSRAKQMLADGYTRGEVASQLGVSISTLDMGVIEASGINSGSGD